MYAVQVLLAAECLASAYNTVSGWQWQMVKCGLQFRIRDKVRLGSVLGIGLVLGLEMVLGLALFVTLATRRSPQARI